MDGSTANKECLIVAAVSWGYSLQTTHLFKSDFVLKKELLDCSMKLSYALEL
jgi:hypothetical protein